MDELKTLRRKIDDVDEAILVLLCQRAKICQEIGSEKKAQGLPVRDSDLEAKVFDRIRKRANELGLNSVQVEAVYREIVNMCSSVQE
jgi:chorismate mutase